MFRRLWCGVLVGFMLVSILCMPLAQADNDGATSVVAINSTNFPDAHFREEVKNYDTNKDGKLSATEINDVIDMSCRYASISSLEGIEYFSKLEILDCEGNSLTKLDVSKCTALGSLYCLNNKLTSLNVSGCKELATLECEKNKLTSLDISNNTALISLDCFNNKLTSLNLNKNANLEHLNCANNQISSLNVTNCTYIKEYVQKNSRLTVNNVDTWGDGNGNFEVLTVDRTVKVTAGSVVSKPTLKTVKSKNGKYELSGSTATLVGVTNKKLTTLTVADTIKDGGKTYKVTKIAASACKGLSKLTKLNIGKNIKEIGKDAFNGCKKLKTINFKGTALKKIGSGAFKNIVKKATFNIPKKVFNNYKKMIKKAGASSAKYKKTK